MSGSWAWRLPWALASPPPGAAGRVAAVGCPGAVPLRGQNSTPCCWVRERAVAGVTGWFRLPVGLCSWFQALELADRTRVHERRAAHTSAHPPPAGIQPVRCSTSQTRLPNVMAVITSRSSIHEGFNASKGSRWRPGRGQKGPGAHSKSNSLARTNHWAPGAKFPRRRARARSHKQAGRQAGTHRHGSKRARQGGEYQAMEAGARGDGMAACCSRRRPIKSGGWMVEQVCPVHSRAQDEDSFARGTTLGLRCTCDACRPEV